MDFSASRRECDPLMAGPVLGGAKNLVDQAESLGRAIVMKDVVGPAYAELLEPVYDTDLSPSERSNLPPIGTYDDMAGFSDGLKDILVNRFESLRTQTVDGIYGYNEILALKEARPDLFFYGDDHIFKDGLFSSVVTPMTVAGQIHLLERSGSESNAKYGQLIMRGPLQPKDLIEIMERPEFDDMLMHLTKGPNGFLGGRSSDLHIDYPGFFNFLYPATTVPENDRLPFKRAYKLENGKVVGLSDDYHIAAQLRRRMAKSGASFVEYRGNIDSSGCPVRHSFPNPETGEAQEPLVITAKNFLVAALRAKQEQPEQEAA